MDRDPNMALISMLLADKGYETSYRWQASGLPSSGNVFGQGAKYYSEISGGSLLSGPVAPVFAVVIRDSAAMQQSKRKRVFECASCKTFSKPQHFIPAIFSCVRSIMLASVE